MSINWALLPLKGHYGLFNSAMGSLVPNLPTYARQLGYSAATIGIIYSILPIFGLFAKPLFGFLADKFKIHKPILIFFQVLTLLSFVGIPFVHLTENTVEEKNPVELECHDNDLILTACYQPESAIDQCKINYVGHMNDSVICKMKCNMTTSTLWQHNCDNSTKKSMCISQTDSFHFTPNISKLNRHDCFRLSPREVLSKGYDDSPLTIGCTGTGLNKYCQLECNGTKLSTTIAYSGLSFTCVKESYIEILICKPEFKRIYIPSTTQEMGICEIKCSSERVLTVVGECVVHYTDEEDDSICIDDRSSLEFEASIAPSSIIVDNNCVSFDLKHVMINNNIQNLTCPNTKLPHWKKEYQPQCMISCEDKDVNNLIGAAAENDEDTISLYGIQFWIFCLLMALSWIGQAVVVTFSDAICFDILGPNSLLYGKQRLWGSAGWGIFSFITGLLIDRMSDGVAKDYSVAFIIMGIFLVLDTIVVGYFLKVQTPHVSLNIMRDVGSMVSSWASGLFILWTIPVGICTGLLWQFHFFLIEDVAKLNCEEEGHVKTIQGLVNAIQMFGGEIPAMFVSGYVLNKVGHHNMMSLILFAFSLRYILYSWLYNAWLFLPIEVLQGVTIGMIYPTMASYAHVVAPSGTEATVQGLVGAIFEGVGASLGSYIGGHLYGIFGGWQTFRYFGYFAFITGVLHAAVIYILKKKHTLTVPPEMIPVVTFIRTPEDMHRIIGNDMD